MSLKDEVDTIRWGWNNGYKPIFTLCALSMVLAIVAIVMAVNA